MEEAYNGALPYEEVGDAERKFDHRVSSDRHFRLMLRSLGLARADADAFERGPVDMQVLRRWLRLLPRLRSLTWWLIDYQCVVEKVNLAEYRQFWARPCSTFAGTWQDGIPRWLGEHGCMDLAAPIKRAHQTAGTYLDDPPCIHAWAGLLNSKLESAAASATREGPEHVRGATFSEVLSPQLFHPRHPLWAHGVPPFTTDENILLYAALPEFVPAPVPIWRGE